MNSEPLSERMKTFLKNSILFWPSDRKTNIALATITLVVINVIVFFLMNALSISVFESGGVRGYQVDVNGQWWRLVSSAFLHEGYLHIFLNMLAIFLIGQRLEWVAGTQVLLGAYFVSMLGCSAGALLYAPNIYTVGASGALYGLMGCALVVEQRSDKNPWLDGVALVLVISVIVGFILEDVSHGGHIGGFVAGLLVGLIAGDARKAPRRQVRWVGFAVLFVAAFVACLRAASTWRDPFF